MSSKSDDHPSLERRLQWTLGILLLLTLVALAGATAWIGRAATERFVASRLAHDAEALIAGLDPVAHRLSRELPPVYDQPFSGHYFLVRFEQGPTLRARSLWDRPLDGPRLEPGRSATVWRDGPRGQRLLMWASGYEKQGQRFTVAVAEDISPLLEAFRRVLALGIALALGVAAVLLWVQRRILRRGFAPLETVREDVRRLTRGETGALREDVPSEVHPLVSEFNQLITAWSAHLERSRNAVGNLAHALKTPLQLIIQQGADQNDDTLAEQAKRMRQLIERELHRARIAGRAAPARHFHPAADSRDLVDTLKTLHRDKALEIDTDVRAPAQLPLDQADMLELLGNLLDNAAKWARSRITLTVSAGENLLVCVEDDGPGIPPAAAKALTERGVRLDERAPGHGLGLAIVADIVAHYGGSLTIDRSSRLGGMRVMASLPLALSQPR